MVTGKAFSTFLLKNSGQMQDNKTNPNRKHDHQKIFTNFLFMVRCLQETWQFLRDD